MPTTTPEFLDALRDAGLFEPEQIESFARRRAADGPALARELVADGLLTEFQAGRLLEGRGRSLALGAYRLLGPLGEGGMGQVFKAVQRRLDRLAAVKVLHPSLTAGNPQAVRRFEREARAVAGLSHPNVVVVYDADHDGDTYYIAMEYVEGTDLAKLVRQSGPLSVSRACDYARQAAEGLQHAHEAGLVHRDVKPHNLMLTFPAPVAARSGVIRREAVTASASGRLAAAGLVKVLDLGLVRVLGDDAASALSLTGPSFMGTPDYIAPEQARDARAADGRSDVYSLGCTLYYLLAGRPPFPADSSLEKLMMHQNDEPTPVEQLRREVTPAVARVVRKMMAKRPADRFPDARAAADALQEAAGPATGSGSWARGPAAPAAGRCGTDAPSTVVVGAPARAGGGPATRGDLRLGGPRAEKVAELRGHTAAVAALAFSADGIVLASGGIDASVRVWDLSDRRPRGVACWSGAHLDGLAVLAVRPRHAELAVGRSAADGRVLRWAWPADAASAAAGDPHPVEAVAFSPDGSLMATAGGLLGRVWSLAPDGSRKLGALRGHFGPVKAVAFAPGGKHLATAGQDSVIRLWQVGNWWCTLRNVLVGHSGAVTHLAYSPDGAHLASAGLDQAVRVWDATGAEAEPRAVFGRLDGPARALAFADDRRVLAVADRGQVVLGDVPGRARLREWRLDAGLACCFAVTPGGTVAAAASDGRVTLFDLGLTPPEPPPAPPAEGDSDSGEVSLDVPPDGAEWKSLPGGAL